MDSRGPVVKLSSARLLSSLVFLHLNWLLVSRSAIATVLVGLLPLNLTLADLEIKPSCAYIPSYRARPTGSRDPESFLASVVAESEPRYAQLNLEMCFAPMLCGACGLQTLGALFRIRKTTGTESSRTTLGKSKSEEKRLGTAQRLIKPDPCTTVAADQR